MTTQHYELSESVDDEPTPGRSPRALMLTILSVLFVGSGLFWGVFFVSRVEAALGIAGQRMLGGTNIGIARAPSTPLDGLTSLLSKAAPTPTETPPEWTDTERINILLLGVDQRPDERERGDPVRSDTIIVVSIDPVEKTAAMLSVPRDMWVPIPVDTNRPIEAKITTAHFFGDYMKYPGGGAALAKKTVEYNLGVRINYYAKINFDGFRRVVDVLGGLDICVPSPLIDNEYPTDDYGIKRVFIPAGMQHLDGETALEYARSRHQDSDFGRSSRQRQVLMAMRDRALRLDLVPRAPQLAAEFGNLIDTDIPLPDMIKLANLGRQIPTENIESRAIDANALQDFWTSDGQEALLPIRSEVKKIVAETLLGQAPQATDTPAATTPVRSGSTATTAEPADTPAKATPTAASQNVGGC